MVVFFCVCVHFLTFLHNCTFSILTLDMFDSVFCTAGVHIAYDTNVWDLIELPSTHLYLKSNKTVFIHQLCWPVSLCPRWLTLLSLCSHFQIWWEGKCVQLHSAENISDQRNKKSVTGTISRNWIMAQSHYAKKGSRQDREMVRFHASNMEHLFVFFYVIVFFYPLFFRSHEHIEILTVNGELLFFRQREGPFYPTLRLLHKCKSNVWSISFYISVATWTSKHWCEQILNCHVCVP